jgi:PEP-CTERM motif-containing protein
MNRTRIAWSLVALICLMLVASQGSAANLLANPGFEDPVTSDGPPFIGSWEAFNGGAGTSSNNSTTTPRNGLQDLRTAILNTDNTFAGAFQDVPVVAGSPALWSVWHMTSSDPLDLTVEMRIEWRNSVSNTEIARTPNFNPVPVLGQYTQASLLSTVPAGVDIARVVYAIQTFSGGPTNNGIVFVDDAFFDMVPEPATALLLGMGAYGSVIFWRRSRIQK